MERESLEDFGHMLDIDDVTWAWFWISCPRILVLILNRGMCGHVGEPNH